VPALTPADAVPASAGHPQDPALNVVEGGAPTSMAAHARGTVGADRGLAPQLVPDTPRAASPAFSGVNPETPDVQLQREPVINGAISPDGKYLAYSDAAGIHVKLLSTGDERLIHRPAGVPSEAVWSLDSWFPDSTHLLADTVGPGAHDSIWTVSVLGQSARKLREGAGAWEISPDAMRFSFSPITASGDYREIWVMGSQGDNPQKVLALGENYSLQNVHWAPDGKRLAYTSKPRNASDFLQAAIETCDVTGANRTVVVPAADLRLGDFCRLPDSRIVYSREESADSLDGNLWQVGVDGRTGAPTGKPKRIIQWSGSFLGSLYANADGKRLTLLKATPQSQVYLGELPVGGRGMSVPRRLTNDEYVDLPSAWTTDSEAVLLFSDRNGTFGIFKQGISQETARLSSQERKAHISQVSAPMAPGYSTRNVQRRWASSIPQVA